MLAIITVLYENYDVLDDFFSSLLRQTDADFHVYVVDLTPYEKRHPVIFPNTHFSLLFAENKGYAHGVNIGIAQANEDHLVENAIVNPDIIFSDDFVAQASRCIAAHPHSILGAKIWYAPGYEYHKEKYPNLDGEKVIWYAGGKIDWAHATTKHVGVDDIDHQMYDEEMVTDFATGCCILYDRYVYDQVGRWDEKYFMYYEDADYCLRAKEHNIFTLYTPSITLWHKNAQSTGGSGSDFHMRAMEKSRLRFGLKYAPWRTKLHLIKNSL